MKIIVLNFFISQLYQFLINDQLPLKMFLHLKIHSIVKTLLYITLLNSI